MSSKKYNEKKEGEEAEKKRETKQFHTAWGEFGWYKSKDALKFEVASMLTYGARCSVGDQLHSDGEFDVEKYRTLGYAYGYVKQIEDYCYDGTQTSEFAIYLSDNDKSDEGIVKMLLNIL